MGEREERGGLTKSPATVRLYIHPRLFTRMASQSPAHVFGIKMERKVEAV